MNIYEHDVERLLYLNTIRDRVACVFGFIALFAPAPFDTMWIMIVVFIVSASLLFLLYKLLLKYLVKDVEAVIAALRCDIDALGENIEYYDAERKRYTEAAESTDDLDFRHFLYDQSEYCYNESNYLWKKRSIYREYLNRLTDAYSKHLKY